VNDIPLPRQKLQDPVPLAQGVWLGSLRQLDKIVELKSCGVRAIVNMLGPRWQKESLNGMRLQYPEDWGSFRSSGSRHCRSEDPAEPSRPNLQVHAVLPLAEEANFCSLQDGYQQVHDCLCGSLVCLLKWPLPQALIMLCAAGPCRLKMRLSRRN